MYLETSHFKLLCILGNITFEVALYTCKYSIRSNLLFYICTSKKSHSKLLYKYIRSCFINLETLHSKVLYIMIRVMRLRLCRLSPGDAMDPRHERTASGAPSASLGHRAFSRCRNATSSAVHESGSTPSWLVAHTPLFFITSCRKEL